MTRADDLDRRLSRTEASRATEPLGWRYLLGALATSVTVPSLSAAADIAARCVAGCGDDADGHLRVDVRPDRLDLTLQTRSISAVTARDVRLAESVSTVIRDGGYATAGVTSADLPRPVQQLELAIDALDPVAIRPFWKAVLAYVDEPGHDDPDDAIVDPAGQLPAIWFQQMDAPRPQRNRIHFDVTVAHDEAESRIAAAIAAGGTLVDDSAARSFWILADAEGNEVCVCTWLDRDEREAARRAAATS